MNQRLRVLACVVALAGCAAEASAPAPEDPESVAAQGQGEDLFAGELPDLLVDAHALQLDGQLLPVSLARALYDFALAEGDDSRPWLLLARDSMLRGWGGVAVRQYRAAIEADARAGDQPGVLRDLVFVAGALGGQDHRDATALIARVYGRDALPMIDAALVQATAQGDALAITRLEDARAQMPAR